MLGVLGSALSTREYNGYWYDWRALDGRQNGIYKRMNRLWIDMNLDGKLGNRQLEIKTIQSNRYLHSILKRRLQRCFHLCPQNVSMSTYSVNFAISPRGLKHRAPRAENDRNAALMYLTLRSGQTQTKSSDKRGGSSSLEIHARFVVLAVHAEKGWPTESHRASKCLFLSIGQAEGFCSSYLH